MKYIRRFNESKHDDIKAICEQYKIANYTINNDGSIDVDGNVSIINRKITKLPLRFRNVTGSFDCSDNQLTTLEGSPQSVEYSFSCSGNKLTTLKGSPRTTAHFYCSDNKLTTLEGSPNIVNGSFICSNNQLVNLDFAPSCKDLYCYDNPISKWWLKVIINNNKKLTEFIDLGIDARDADFMNQEKIDLLNE